MRENVALYFQGHFEVINMTLDVKMLELMPIAVENKEWNVTLETTDNNDEPWLCFHFVFKIFRMGRRRVPG